MGYIANIYKIFRGTTAGDDTGTPARTAAQGLNDNADAINNALATIDTAAEKKANKVNNLDNANGTTYPTSAAVKAYSDAKDGLANQYTNAQLQNYQAKAEKGVANGYVPLDANTKVAATYLPGFVEEIVEGSYVNNTTFEDNVGTAVVLTTGKIYLDTTTSKAYRYGGTVLVEIVASPGTTDEVPEGATSKYFSEARVRATILTGLSLVNSAAITAADSIVTAFGKLQKQITDLTTTVGAKLDKGAYTGDAQDLYDFAATKETPLGAQAKADTAYEAAIDYANGLQGAVIPVETYSDLSLMALVEDVLYLVKDEVQLYVYDFDLDLLFKEGSQITAQAVIDALGYTPANEATVVKSIAVNGDTYNRDVNGLVDLGTISGGGTGLDLRASNLAPDLSTAEKDGIKTKLSIVEGGNSTTPDPLIITANHLLTAANNNGYIGVQDYASIAIPSGLGLKYRVDIGKDTDKTVSITGSEKIVLEYPNGFLPEIDTKYNGITLLPKRIVNSIEYWGIYGAQKVGNLINGLKSTVKISNLSIPQMTFPYIYKSSDYTLFTTTKPYFTIYSTDHAGDSSAQIWWGEMDDPEWNGFIERARINVPGDGYQVESPILIKIPQAVHGKVWVDEYFMYYHTNASDPSNAVGIQETHLVTTSGGNAPHLCTYTERKNNSGANVLGLAAGENHTGYANIFKKADGTYLSIHSNYATSNAANNTSAVSTSPDGLNWTRQVTFGENRIIPDGSGKIHARLQIHPFEYNGIMYAFILSSNSKLSLCTVDNNYLPSVFLKDVYDMTGYYQITDFKLNGVMYLGLRDSTAPNFTGDWYQLKYNLNEI